MAIVVSRVTWATRAFWAGLPSYVLMAKWSEQEKLFNFTIVMCGSVDGEGGKTSYVMRKNDSWYS